MKNKRVSSFINKYAVPIILLMFVFLIQAFHPNHRLLTWENFQVILTQSTILGLISLGLSIIVIAGVTDMSIGGTVGLIGAIFAVSMVNGRGPALSVLLALGVCAVLYVVFTLLLAKFNYSSIIISICLMFICMGIERLYTDGKSIWLNNESIQAFATGTVLGIPNLVYFLIGLYVICYIFVNHTRLGYKIRVVGENASAAIETGINIQKIKILAFGMAFVLYGIASVLEPIRLGGSQLYAGQTYLLPAMAATFLGSSMITPGRVNLIGTLIGSVFMGVIMNFLTFLGAEFYFIPLAQGLLLLAGVALGTIRDRSVKQVRL
jgi:ribose/xylose/arabinose/galactoside ABC-type transport system permease subunit